MKTFGHQGDELIAGGAATSGAILVVDDNMDDAAFVRVMLRKLKVRNPVSIVATAEEMMAYLNGEGMYADREMFPYPILILLDLRLPQKDGMAAQAWLRASRKHRKTPLVMISSKERLATLKTAVELGANAYMVKPFDSGEFGRLASKWQWPVAY